MTEELVKGSEYTTVDSYDPKVKAKAYELFLTTDLSMTDIAIDLGISSKVVASWSRQGKWMNRKKEVEMELFKSAESDYRALVVQNRVPVVKRHLRISEKVEESIERVLDEILKDEGIPNDMKVKRMAEALSVVSAVSARAAGVTDRPFSDNLDEDGNKKVPLIMVNVQASAPPGVKMGEVKAKVIDVNP
jgi:transposase-like protein